MPHPDTYWPSLLRRLGAKPWTYRPRGVPRKQQEKVLKRLVVGELRPSKWVDPKIRRAATKAIREGWRERLLAPAGAPNEAAGHAQHRRRDGFHRAASTPDSSRSLPRSEPPRPEADPSHLRGDAREKVEQAGVEEEAGREDTPSDDAPREEPAVPGLNRQATPRLRPKTSAGSEGLTIRNGAVTVTCWFCTAPNPAREQICRTCGKDLRGPREEAT